MAKAKSILIQNGQVIDPANGYDNIADLLIINGRIEAVGTNLAAPDGSTIINAKNLIVSPGLVDPHCHLRQPGFEYKVTIYSGSRAAAAGGFTTTSKICTWVDFTTILHAISTVHEIIIESICINQSIFIF